MFPPGIPFEAIALLCSPHGFIGAIIAIWLVIK